MPCQNGVPSTGVLGCALSCSAIAPARNALRQARTAAKQKQCAAVKVIAERARKLDAAYYASTFAADADVKTCL